MTSGGGRYDFDDGGTYCGGWEDGKAHGHGVCTGPKGMGEYSGSWAYGYEASGVYTWPSGNCFSGQWMTGKRHGVGVETKGRWVYRGEWTTGFKGRYGIRQSTTSGAKYEGTWTTGLQDGYGVESYADGGTYMGQWLRGTRHGYGVRQSVPYALAAHYRPKALRTSLTSIRSENEDERIVKARDRKLDESRGGFVLKANSEDTENPMRRKSIFDKHGRSSLKKTILSSLKMKKQRSTGDLSDSPQRMGLRPGRPTGSMRSTVSAISQLSTDSAVSSVTNHSMTDAESNHSFVSQDDILDASVTETYMGEWKNDKRCGFGISERTDGLKYEGEWYNNKKYGYGITYFKDGTKEEGKYKNNILVAQGKKKLFTRTAKVRERIDNAVMAARRAAQIALQKSEIAQSRMTTARAKADEADQAANKSRQDSDVARIKAKDFAPEFHQPGVVAMTALSSALDCALAGSSTKVGQGLNKLQGNEKATPQHLGVDLYSNTNGGIGQSPRLTPRGSRKSHGSFRSSRRRRHEGEITRSTILSDHFDQYGDSVSISDGKAGRDSGLGKELSSNSVRDMTDSIQKPKRTINSNKKPKDNISDVTPDSGTDSLDMEDLKQKSTVRRNSLPCIVKAGVNVSSEKSTAPRMGSSINTPEIFIIENGIRKRLQSQNNMTAEADNSSQPDLPKRFTFEKPQRTLASIGPRGSLPDITACEQLKKDVTPRAVMSKMSEQRRQEIRLQREEEERKKEGDIVLRFGDMKDWCQQRQLMMLVIGLNVTLATMFFNLLAGQH